ncbi:threonine/serine exporter family protein [Paenibacillus sp. SC116]|uniref:threonine/serine exporter family protein n=1 Tax=Paenibacillus sp. SC116 TaxID=2968986 RepID=UPI00215B5C55|nr:threonine/serine exporter family protein [Paenibacillus sp. SC116]MCR8844574.1 threonine/serine exporter family protein [Paenibacillus sp. SC116]
MLIEHLITSFISSAGFGIIFNVPRKTLLQCGFVGMAGWCVYITLSLFMGIDVIPATLAASFLVAVVSQLFARMYKVPIIVYSVAGIIPLVPGGMAYDAMRKMVENNYTLAIELTIKAFMLSGSIAIGLVFSEVVNQIITKYQARARY